MNKLKIDRIRILKECIEKIKEIQELYVSGTSGWILLQAAHEQLTSLYYLEAETNFNEGILGVRFKDET